jgi:hypothetical protein
MLSIIDATPHNKESKHQNQQPNPSHSQSLTLQAILRVVPAGGYGWVDS